MPGCSAESAPRFPPREPPLLLPRHGEEHRLPPASPHKPRLRTPPLPRKPRFKGEEAKGTWSRDRAPTTPAARGNGERRSRADERELLPTGAEGRSASAVPRPARGRCRWRWGALDSGAGTGQDGTVMGRTLVELFYDVVSPYSWLGFEVRAWRRQREAVPGSFAVLPLPDRALRAAAGSPLGGG